MQLISKKDSYAFEMLYDRYSRRMLNYFFKMLWKDKEKAEDFMQDLFLKIIHKPELFNPGKSFKTWIYSVANNMCKNEYKKQEVRAASKGKILEGQHEIIEENFNMQIDFKSFNATLDKELNELEAIKKTTFVLRYREGLSVKEISDIMECSEGTVKSRLFYTLKALTPKLSVFNPIESEV